MNRTRHTALALALATAFPLTLPATAAAQSSEELLKELKALKDRVAELEAKARAAEAAKPAQAQWGMTPEQAAEFSRVQVKAEAMEDNFEAAGLKGLKITGFIEPTFIYNQRQDRAGFQFLNDQSAYYYDTSFLGAATIDFTKELESGTRFKLTLTPNRGVGAAIGGGIVQEASVSVPTLDQKTRFIAGQIPDWSGYEYQQPTLNPFTTHNLLYDFTLPLGYTGVGMDVMVDQWWIRSAIGNVNATMRRESEKSPALSVRVDYAKGEFSGFGGAVLFGKAPNFKYGDTPTNTMALLAEVDGFFTRGDWTFQGQFTYGQQQKAAITDAADGSFRDAQWIGVSGMTGYNVTPRLQALVRADYLHNTKNGGGLFTYNSFDARNGIGPDPSGDPDRGANRYAVTLGLKYAFNANTTLKAEYRLDGADRAVFGDVKGGITRTDDGIAYKEFRKTNSLLGASVVVFF